MHIQWQMSQIPTDIKGAVFLIDDILVLRQTQKEHGDQLIKVLENSNRLYM